LLLIDDAERWRFQLDTAELIQTASRKCALVLGANSTSFNGNSGTVAAKLILLTNDACEDLLLGVPNSFAGQGKTPGRAVWHAPPGDPNGSDPILCQLPIKA